MPENRLKETTYILKMLSASLLHLNLYGTVLRINVVEKLLAGLAGVSLDLVVEIFIDVDKAAFLGNLQAKVVQSGIFIVNIHSCDGFLQRRRAVDHH